MACPFLWASWQMEERAKPRNAAARAFTLCNSILPSPVRRDETLLWPGHPRSAVADRQQELVHQGVDVQLPQGARRRHAVMAVHHIVLLAQGVDLDRRQRLTRLHRGEDRAVARRLGSS